MFYTKERIVYIVHFMELYGILLIIFETKVELIQIVCNFR